VDIPRPPASDYSGRMDRRTPPDPDPQELQEYPKVVLLPNLLRNMKPEKFFSNPIGAGEYKVENISKDKKNLSIVLVDRLRNSKSIYRYTFESVSQDEAIRGFNAGHFQDLEAFQLDSTALSLISRESKDFDVSGYSTYFMFFNGLSKFSKDLNNRVLVRSVYDFSKINNVCKSEYLEMNGIVPKGTLGWVSEKKVINANLHAMKKTQNQVIRIMTWGNENNNCAINTAVKSISDALNIKIDFKIYDLKKAIEVFYKGDYDIFIDRISLRGPEPYHLFSFFDPTSPHTLIKFNDNQISRLTENLHSLPLRNSRAELYKRISNYIVNDKIYAIPLFSDITHFIFSNTVDESNLPAVIRGTTRLVDVRLK
jgi:hypothetical protein